MEKDASYHKSAIQFNEELADFARELAQKLENEEVRRWARVTSKQHRYHANKHKKSLARIEARVGEGHG
jgi:rubrerythrin